MEFDVDDLEDIYLTYMSYRILDTPIILKILKQYTFFDVCNHLIAKSMFDRHQFLAHDIS